MPHPGDNKYMATALLALRKKLTRQDVMAEVPGDHCFFVRYSGTVVVTNFTGLAHGPAPSVWHRLRVLPVVGTDGELSDLWNQGAFWALWC